MIMDFQQISPTFIYGFKNTNVTHNLLSTSCHDFCFSSFVITLETTKGRPNNEYLVQYSNPYTSFPFPFCPTLYQSSLVGSGAAFPQAQGLLPMEYLPGSRNLLTGDPSPPGAGFRGELWDIMGRAPHKVACYRQLEILYLIQPTFGTF